MQDPKTSELKACHPAWRAAVPAILAAQAVLVLLCLSACGGGGDDPALSTVPQPPGVDPRLLIQAASAPLPEAQPLASNPPPAR